MMSRTKIKLDEELQQRARERAAHLNISFAEYIRRLVSRDLVEQRQSASPTSVFDLGCSHSSDIANNKDPAIGAAVDKVNRR